jgi:ABC-type Fe3+ transport system substrate-binding protein
MIIRSLSVLSIASVLLIFSLPVGGDAADGPALQKLKQDAQAKGFIFETSHDEIVAKAKKEGKARILTSLEAELNKPVADAFRKKYPFIDLKVEEISGTDTYQRMLLEMKAGSASGWDVNYMTTDYYADYLPHQKKFDILGMAQQGVLKIPPPMIDPVNRNVISYTTMTQIVAYNKTLIAEDKVPNQWDDFLKPEFKGRKFLVDIRPQEVANLVPVWGLEKTLQFAKAIAAQNPIWIRGHSRNIASLAAGEYPMLLGANLSTTKKAMEKDRSGALAYKVVEPIPIRAGDQEAVFEKAVSPYAGLLWLEFVVSPEAQSIIDRDTRGSVYLAGTTPYRLTQGKKTSLVTWEYAPKLEELQKRVFEAYGFPKAQSGGK